MKLGWFGLGMGAFADPEGVADLAAAAEAFGYESVWLGEHPVLIDPHQRPSPLPPQSELLDPIAVLAYAAARTTTVRLGTGIVLLPLRNPVTLAKELASVDVLSRGRLILGVGVGYVNGEYDALGVEFKTRGRRADESLDALRILWTEERPEMHGAFVDFAGIQCRPWPVQPGCPPILGSGMSTAARRRAVAKCHGWVLRLPP
jgi:probable F420-dependent oxidoreductase